MYTTFKSQARTRRPYGVQRCVSSPISVTRGWWWSRGQTGRRRSYPSSSSSSSTTASTTASLYALHPQPLHPEPFCGTAWYHASGFRVQSPGFRVQGSGFRVRGLGCRVEDERAERGYLLRAAAYLPLLFSSPPRCKSYTIDLETLHPKP